MALGASTLPTQLPDGTSTLLFPTMETVPFTSYKEIPDGHDVRVELAKCPPHTQVYRLFFDAVQSSKFTDSSGKECRRYEESVPLARLEVQNPRQHTQVSACLGLYWTAQFELFKERQSQKVQKHLHSPGTTSDSQARAEDIEGDTSFPKLLRARQILYHQDGSRLEETHVMDSSFLLKSSRTRIRFISFVFKEGGGLKFLPRSHSIQQSCVIPELQTYSLIVKLEPITTNPDKRLKIKLTGQKLLLNSAPELEKLKKDERGEEKVLGMVKLQKVKLRAMTREEKLKFTMTYYGADGSKRDKTVLSIDAADFFNRFYDLQLSLSNRDGFLTPTLESVIKQKMLKPIPRQIYSEKGNPPRIPVSPQRPPREKKEKVQPNSSTLGAAAGAAQAITSLFFSTPKD